MRTLMTLTVAVFVAGAGGADAKTFEVTRFGDPSPGNCKPSDCSLREAVLAANERPGRDKVVLPSRRRPYKLTIPNEMLGVQEDGGMTGDLDVSNDALAIVHPGRGKATVRGAAGLDDKLCTAFAGAPLTISKLRLTGGDAQGDQGSGGAIDAGARLLVKRSTLAGNQAEGTGGAITLGDNTPLRLIRSTLARNEAGTTGGAIRNGLDGPITIIGSRLTGNRAANDGGAMRLSSNGPAVIKRSTISGNRAGADGGGIQNDGENTLRITGSTISGNFAEGGGGGVQVRSGSDPTTIVNSTVAGNRALSFGGGIYVNGDGVVALNAVSIVRNVADLDDNQGIAAIGGGVFGENADSFAVRNSIIALNLDAAVGNDCEGMDPVDSLGNNLISTDLGCDDFDGPNDRIRSNPKLGSLKRNGGPTKTVALKQGSAAIGKAHKPSAPDRDQRGRRRDSNPDIGAFERGA